MWDSHVEFSVKRLINLVHEEQYETKAKRTHVDSHHCDEGHFIGDQEIGLERVSHDDVSLHGHQADEQARNATKDVIHDDKIVPSPHFHGDGKQRIERPDKTFHFIGEVSNDVEQISDGQTNE